MILLLLVLAGLQYRLWFGDGSWEQIVYLQREIERQKSVNQGLSDRNKILENEVRDLKNGMGSIEERARSELGLIKDGETFYLLIDTDKQP